MRDLAIAYRIYPGVSKKPAFHHESKLDLARLCLTSFRQALGDLRFKVWAILDGCPPEFRDLFQSVFSEEELEIIETDAIGNLLTFEMQIDLLTQQTEADLVYFAEDDYFYRLHALVEMVEFARGNTAAEFVTPYDHPDSYVTSSRNERHQVMAFGRRHWREASSTCLTFLTTKTTLVATSRILRSYSKGNMDCSLWLALTQKSALANPQVHAADRNRFKIWLKAWIWGWRDILFSRNIAFGHPCQRWPPIWRHQNFLPSCHGWKSSPYSRRRCGLSRRRFQEVSFEEGVSSNCSPSLQTAMRVSASFLCRLPSQ